MKSRGGEKFRRDGLGIEPAFRGGARQFAGGGGDLFLAAIIEGEGEIEAGILGGAAFGIQDHLLDVAGDAAAMADDAHADIALDQLVHVAAEIGAEQAHQGAHFGLGPLPVLADEKAKRVRFSSRMSQAARTVSRTAFMPANGRPRAADGASSPSGHCRP